MCACFYEKTCASFLMKNTSIFGQYSFNTKKVHIYLTKKKIRSALTANRNFVQIVYINLMQNFILFHL